MEVTTVRLEWQPRAGVPDLARSIMRALDSFELGRVFSSSVGARACRVEFDVEGDKSAVHAAVDEARTKLRPYAEGGVVRWLQPKE